MESLDNSKSYLPGFVGEVGHRDILLDVLSLSIA